jgi:hypothetical protein
MAKQYAKIEPEHREFIERQHIFFASSATANSRVNVSPKGLDALRILDEKTVAYLDLTGSGSEVAAHLRADGRLTLMFCAFEGRPLILRLFGRGRSLLRRSAEYAQVLETVFAGSEQPGARQIVILDVDLVQTSCGFGVPLFDYAGERPTLIDWAINKEEDGLEVYRREKNAVSMDGLPTGFVEDRRA